MSAASPTLIKTTTISCRWTPVGRVRELGRVGRGYKPVTKWIRTEQRKQFPNVIADQPVVRVVLLLAVPSRQRHAILLRRDP